MLPTPHGPTDVPLPAGAGDATVDKGRAPDEVALLRVVEHLADVPDGAAADGEPVSDEATQDPADDTAGDPADDTADNPAPDPAPTAAYEIGPVAAALSDTRHRIDELNAPERLFLAQQRALVAGLCADPSDAALVGALFDRVREQWQQADDRPDPRPLADVFGIALGDLVCAQAEDLGWATCSDRHGTEIVLAREDPEILVYPVAAVAQHWDEASPGWFQRHLATVVHGVLQDRAPTGG
ncbi:DUF3806 domain-containing protein [Cellulomonas dongxiuzhuiae]|uniref:DUF3806 domain-containing protein n=1 Tax=Cellulomonas dongxiuzhuiae TaxID=2819979 RepID=UPI001AAE9468|nr:DUF3806 domain-containing protein [Cellulomonas dongxiuzhuiae]MBO3089925.1 DUF3806 domain-containing protein [Cellulomonas dongxiuzhuiae]